MSTKVSMFFRHPADVDAEVDFDPDTLIQTIETYLDVSGWHDLGEDLNVYADIEEITD